MSSLETLKRGGKTYLYLVRSLRLNGKSRKVKLYLGLTTPSPKELKQKEALLDVKIEELKASQDSLLRLLTPEQLKRLKSIKSSNKAVEDLKQLRDKSSFYEWFVTKFTYDTNAIEGGTLTEKEVSTILFEEVISKESNLRDVSEARNHKKAFDYMLSELEKGRELDLKLSLKLHEILMKDTLPSAGRIRDVQVYIRGVELVPPKPSDVLPQLKQLFKWYSKNRKKYHPVILAGYFHCAFEAIHPFRDGNGRTGRLLLNFTLLKNSFPPVDIRNKKKIEYYLALQEAEKGNLKTFVDLLYDYLVQDYTLE